MRLMDAPSGIAPISDAHRGQAFGDAKPLLELAKDSATILHPVSNSGHIAGSRLNCRMSHQLRCITCPFKEKHDRRSTHASDHAGVSRRRSPYREVCALSVFSFPEPQGKAASRKATIPRRDIFLWATAILFCNYLLGATANTSWHSPSKLLSDLAALGVFQIIAWYAVFRLLAASDAAQVGDRRDFLVAIILCLLVFLPTSRMIWVAVLGLATYVRLTGSNDRNLRAAAVVLAALAVQQFWVHIVFDLAAVPLLRAETAAVGTVLTAARPGTLWHDNIITGPGGFGIVLYSGCSSFYNLSTALLCWVTLRSLDSIDWRPRDLAHAAIVGATMIVLNFARLCIMGLNLDLYHYWHDGVGSEIFQVGGSVIILLLSLYCARLRGQGA
jgi:hypothetical protein